MSRFIRHLVVLVYKHLLIKIRKPFQTIVELSFPIQLVFIIWLFTTFGVNFRTRVEHMPINSVTSLCTKNCGKQLGVSQMTGISGALSGTVKDVITSLEERGIATKELSDGTAYQTEYKSLSGGVVFAKVSRKSRFSVGDAVVIANRTDTTGNQTVDYVQGGLLDLQTTLHDAFCKHVKIYSPSSEITKRKNGRNDTDKRVSDQTRQFNHSK